MLGEHGFRRVQGSLYVTENEDMANLFFAIQALRARAWFVARDGAGLRRAKAQQQVPADGRGPLEGSAGRGPGWHRAETGPQPVLQHHRLRRGVATVAPLLAVEADRDLVDGGGRRIGDGHRHPAGDGAAIRAAEVGAARTLAAQRPIRSGAAVAEEAARVRGAGAGLIAGDVGLVFVEQVGITS